MQLAIQTANHVTILLSLTLNLAEIGEPLFNCTRFAKKLAAVVQLHALCKKACSSCSIAHVSLKISGHFT